MVAAAALGCPWAPRLTAVAAVATSSVFGCSPRRLPASTFPFVLHHRRWNSGGGLLDARADGRHVSYWHQPGAEPLLALTLGQLAERAARRWPEREAVVAVHQGRRLTFRQALHQADRLAAGLLSIGMQPGDMLAMCGPNSLEWYITNIAAARAGLVFANINPAYQIPELEYCLSKAGVKALVIPDTFKTQNYHKMMENIVPELLSCRARKLMSKRLPHLKYIISISESDLPGAFRYENLITSSTSAHVSQIQQLQEEIDIDTGCNLQFTSGTTGQPKATLLSHHTLVNNSYCLGKRLNFQEKHHRICLQVPLFHAFGNVIGIITALHCGSTIVIPSYSFRAEDSITAIEKESCTVIYGTPTMFVDIISKSQNCATAFSSLEFAITGGSPMSPSLYHKIAQTCSLKKCLVLYGMTETGPITFCPSPEDPTERCANTVGRVMDHCEIKVVDSEGSLVPMGQAGELLTRGYCNMLCYYNDENKTNEIMGQDRWFRTGDQFILHPDGSGEVVGRLKDMIIRGGENIFPKEIEDCLITHHAVLDAQVIGVPDERLGEEICACIRLNSESVVDAEQLKDFCKGKIAHFKIPKYYKFLSDYPRTGTGKVNKRELRNLIMEKKLH